MESKLYWLVPNQVLYWKLSGSITASEVTEMSRFIITTVSKLPSIQKVHLMIDATDVTALNHADSGARTEFALLARQKWMGQVVAIVHNVQIQIHLNKMSSAFGMKWKTVPSMRKAAQSLQQSDSNVRNIPDVKQAKLIERPVRTSDK